MARPVKDGLDYYPFDVDFDTNAKTEAIMGEFGSEGVVLMVYLLNAVYRRGYFLVWDKLTQMQLINRIQSMNSETANKIVERLIEYGTFSEYFFQNDTVLTSMRIQQTYLDATKRRKGPLPTLYWINVNSNSSEKVVNEDINPQSKVNQSKLNQNKIEIMDSTQNKLMQESVEEVKKEFLVHVWPKFPRQLNYEKTWALYYDARREGTTRQQILDGLANEIEYNNSNSIDERYQKGSLAWMKDRSWETPHKISGVKEGKRSKGNDSFNENDIPF